MSDSFSCGVTRDLGIFDFFRSRTMSLSRRESRSSSQAAAPDRSKAAGRSLAPSASMPPPAPASSFASASSAAAAAASNAPPPLPDESDDDDGFGSAPSSSDSSSSSSVGSAITKYEVVRELGRGATAVVQLGRLRGGDELVALKVFKTSLLKKMREVKRVGRRMVVSTALDKVQVEIAIMKKLHHPNLLNLLEVFDDDSETLVLMLEYAPSGQVMQWYPEEKLYKKEKSKDKNCFSEEELRSCVRQLLLGLEYLHENNICHRDLKPENILVGQDGTFKIADFGVAHFFEEDDKEAKAKAAGEATPAAAKPHKKGYVSTTAGTYAFMGPETLKGGEYSAYAADIWALGITIHALAFGTIPFYDPDVVTLFEMIEKDPIEIENNGNGPEKRWSLQKCKEHAWVLEGLSEEQKQEYVQTSYEAVTVGPEDLACAVTRVTSLNVILRVKLGANKWKRRAMKSLEDRRRSLQDGGSFSESSLAIFGRERARVDRVRAQAVAAAATELASNQLEI
ncbi:CAMKK protein kinase [Phytophthora cinnamomi]|uniref:CAMKK protein kinase n=1 Tax=Phytophthora cinnamomi TaxID=4785 RepID=UPI0035599C47|nr:CAMKK protein kinase [Phytophthora cinnamomi]